MNKKTAIIIGLQTFIIIILFWMLVFYGKDEFEDFRTEQAEEIESIDHVTEKEGISIVSLSPAAQKNSGISTANVVAMAYLGGIKSSGTVMPIDALIVAKTKLLNLETALSSAQTNSLQHQAQYKRLKTLNADDKNVSDLAVQQSLTLVTNGRATVNSKASEIHNLKSSVKLKWGNALTKQALNNQTTPLFQRLLARKNVLIQVSLPFNAPDPTLGSTIQIKPLNGSEPIKARYVSVSTQADSNGTGKTFYYSAPAKNLRIGMRVLVAASSAKNKASNGIVIPSSAVVWYAGTPWAYFREDNNQFIRKPISTDTEVDAGWFNKGVDVNSEVVVRGAQLLLSEEFKYLIKNENDD
ncbi:MAG: hypothetical protein ABGX03_03715 [Methylophilaceae bacterium]